MTGARYFARSGRVVWTLTDSTWGKVVADARRAARESGKRVDVYARGLRTHKLVAWFERNVEWFAAR